MGNVGETVVLHQLLSSWSQQESSIWCLFNQRRFCRTEVAQKACEHCWIYLFERSGPAKHIVQRSGIHPSTFRDDPRVPDGRGSIDAAPGERGVHTISLLTTPPWRWSGPDPGEDGPTGGNPLGFLVRSHRFAALLAAQAFCRSVPASASGMPPRKEVLSARHTRYRLYRFQVPGWTCIWRWLCAGS